MKRKNNLPDAAAEFTQTAAERSADLRDQIIEALAPLFDQAQENLGPIAKDTKKKGAAFAAGALDKAQPHINDALDQVTPAVDSARVHVQENWIPKLSEVLHTAAELPTVAAAAVAAGTEAAQGISKKELKKANKRAKKQAKIDARDFGKLSKKKQKQVLAQLKDMAPEKKRSNRGGFVGVVLALGIVAGVVYLLQKYMGEDSEAGWAAHEPSTAYTQNLRKADAPSHEDEPAKKDAPAKKTDSMDIADAESEGMVMTPAPNADAAVSEQAKTGGADEAFVADENTPEIKAADVPLADHAGKSQGQYDATEPRPFTDAAATAGAGSEKKGYGDGAFVGENPPEGYTIKGNERSMKYHVEGSGGFDRTIADVWFNSEDAAEAAGFTKAQR